MSIKDRLAAKAASIGEKPRTPKAETASTAPKTAPGQLMAFREVLTEKDEEILALKRQLEEAGKPGSFFEIEINQLIEVTGRKRNLSEEEFAELVANLRENDLVSPITVRPTGTEKFEIVSGHNRVAAFRVLGRSKIPAVIHDVEHAKAEVNAFFANLLQPNLPDYEKYLGFCMLKRHWPELTQEEIADRSGISRQQVSRLMSFSKLPAEVHKALGQDMRAIGGNAAQELATLVEKGRHERVIAAVDQVVAGKLNQIEAIAFASAEASPAETKPTKQTAPRAETFKIKQGQSTFCSMRRADKVIRLEFKTNEEAEALLKEIQAFLEEKAKEGKEGK
jgi:ParB family chromosome partitioning protein